ARFIILLRAVALYPSEEHAARALLLDFAGHDELWVYEAIRAAREGRLKLLEYLKDDPFAKNLKKWAQNSHNDLLPEVVATILRESGFLAAFLRGARAGRSLTKLHALWDEIRSFTEGRTDARLSDFIQYLDAVNTHGVRFERELADPESRVTLLTVHKSKGLEFDNVFIVGATESAWNGRERRSAFSLEPKKEKGKEASEGESEATSDERRLFYVALTRAKKRAVISYPVHDVRGRDILPASFVSEIDPHLLSKKEIPVGTPHELATVLFGESKADSMLKSVDRIKAWFDAQGLSATAVNNYLECPWRYFYRSLIHIPEAQEKSALFGSAVHAGLKRFFEPVSNGEKPSLEGALAEFERIVERQSYLASDRAEILEKGRRAIKTYGEQYKEDYPRAVLTEYPVRGVTLGDIPLTGNLDRMDILGDGTVRVVDYKTGKPKSSGEIVKKGLRRQMIFYRLLLDMYENGKYRMREGVLDFVEPDDKGRLKRELVAVTDEEVEELKKDIFRIAEEVRTLAFWDKRCSDKECEYCALREEVGVRKD
ncbi:MAG: PD-(D/E)XK nuclease family protein, partial [Patescibacteria group bacterium]